MTEQARAANQAANAAPAGRRPRAALAMAGDLPDRLFTAAQRGRLAELTGLHPGVLTEFGSDAARRALGGVELLVTGWGCPPVDEDALAAAPGLRAIVHVAGSVKGHVRPCCWERGVAVSTAAQANAEPVAEYTVAMILLAGKRVWAAAAEYRRRRARVDVLREFPDAGNSGRRVGIVGASRIGRRVIELLAPYDLRVAVHDPYLTEDQAARLGVPPVGLDALMAESDVVSLHAPATPETAGMIDARRLALLRDGATLINTARGSLIDQAALAAQLAAGRIDAVLDVTEPDVLPADSPLYDVGHLVLTPHLAGALGNELHRLAALALDELARYTRGEPFAHPVLASDLPHIA